MNEKDLREEEYEEGVIELENEDGSKDKFYHLATIEYKGSKYGVFELAEPQDEEEENGVFIFSMEEDGDDVILNEVEDDDLADAVFQIYLDQAEEYEDGSDGDEE
jgi:hypothetical protein